MQPRKKIFWQFDGFGKFGQSRTEKCHLVLPKFKNRHAKTKNAFFGCFGLFFEITSGKFGCNISHHIFHRARLHAKANGPGVEMPEMKFKALSFTETQLREVVQFIVSPENTSSLAWGEKEYATAEGQQIHNPNQTFS